MRIWLPAMALSVVFTIGAAIPSADAMGGASVGAAGHAMGGFHGHGFGFHHGFGPHPRFFRPIHPFFSPIHPFHQSHLNFGAGFAPNRSNVVAGGVVTGGYGDDDYASDDNYGSYSDDIEDLHFRVQEPFGPGDIGRPPAREEEDAPYMSERMDPSRGYAPDR